MCAWFQVHNSEAAELGLTGAETWVLWEMEICDLWWP